MQLYTLPCSQCAKNIYRSKQRLNESKKFGWQTYCSAVCKSKAKDSSQLLQCTNPQCKKYFKRKPSQINIHTNSYCSRSCAVTINNTKFPKKIAVIKLCKLCSKHFKSNSQYCSKICKNKSQIMSSEYIDQEIKQFYKINQRIPLKVEFPHTKTARLRYGSWNKAIETAGFTPNPVKFAKKHIAKDGHKCDSLSEKIIDDWLYLKSITHEIHIPYHHNNMTADLKINNIFIEFIGLQGVSRVYDRHLMQKENLWKEKGLQVITIYPQDLFPKNRLNEILSLFTNTQTAIPLQ